MKLKDLKKKLDNLTKEQLEQDFIRVMSRIDHHRTYIRHQIEWWSNVL